MEDDYLLPTKSSKGKGAYKVHTKTNEVNHFVRELQLADNKSTVDKILVC